MDRPDYTSENFPDLEEEEKKSTQARAVYTQCVQQKHNSTVATYQTKSTTEIVERPGAWPLVPDVGIPSPQRGWCSGVNYFGYQGLVHSVTENAQWCQ